MPPRIAIVGAGISGLTCAWQLLQDRPGLDLAIFEASDRAGGIIETRREQGFTIELGPDSWVTEKPAARELLCDLGLDHELLPSNDASRLTYLLLNGRLEVLPSNLRMMVPLGRDALDRLEASPSALFSATVLQSFRGELARAAELRRSAPEDDESIASFTLRHFGREVLDRLTAPLLSGVFGGDVRRLSVHAVMAPFVAMEREHGSLIAALGEREAERRAASLPHRSIFTTLRSGLGTLVNALTATLPAQSLHLGSRVLRLTREQNAWVVHALKSHGPTAGSGRRTTTPERFDHVVLALPAHGTAQLLRSVDRTLAGLFPTHSSSAVLVAFGWSETTTAPPPGFGLLVPPARIPLRRKSRLLAATFVDQKFPDRVPPGGRLIRTFLGTSEADRLLPMTDRAITRLAFRELERVLGPAAGPLSPPTLSVVSRWPHSLPQYAVGHLQQIAAAERRLEHHPGLHLLGNFLHGVGLPDLIRQARSLARSLPENVGKSRS